MATRKIERKSTTTFKDTTATRFTTPTSTLKRPAAGSERSYEVDAPARSTRNLSKFKGKKYTY